MNARYARCKLRPRWPRRRRLGSKRVSVERVCASDWPPHANLYVQPILLDRIHTDEQTAEQLTGEDEKRAKWKRTRCATQRKQNGNCTLPTNV